VNEAWLHAKFKDWSATRSGADVQLRGGSDAELFLSDFASPCSNTFWDTDYANTVKGLLPDMPSSSIQVWNPGCGKGYETFSFACILKTRYPNARVKIWANDSDLMAISNAPNMVFDIEEVPEYCKPFLVKGKNGYSFNPAIKDSIVFEYHDVVNESSLPDLDIILIRDLLSFLSAQAQNKLIAYFGEKLRKSGVLFLGKNEVLIDWQSISKDSVSAFMRND
jgi:purine-binding chemotaxis protein CheW